MIASLFLCLFVLGSAWADVDQPDIWFSPDDPTAPGSPVSLAEYKKLFSSSSSWPHAASHVKVFSMALHYIWWAPDDDIKEAVHWLKQHNIKLAIAAGTALGAAPGDATTCGVGEGYESVEQETADIQRIQSLGIVPDMIIMDSSLYFGHYADFSNIRPCHWSIDDVVSQSVAFYRRYQQAFPGIELHSDEPVDGTAELSSSWVADLQQWIEGFKAAGINIGSFHDDIDWSVPMDEHLPQLIAMLNSENVPYGIYITGGSDTNANSDLTWMRAAEMHIRKIKESGNELPAVIDVASWAPYPSTDVPEDSPTALSYLVNYYFNAYLPNRMDLTPSQRPAYVDGGAKIVFQGDGNLVLYDSSGAALWGSLGAAGGYGGSLPNCGSGNCEAVFQGDGNLVLSHNRASYWASNTDERGALLALSGQVPYVQVFDKSDRVIWASSYLNQVSLMPFDLAVNQSVEINDDSGAITYRLVMQGDGNLVMYNESTGAGVWSTSSKAGNSLNYMAGKPTAGMNCSGCRMSFQADGNLVLYDSSGTAYWSSGTNDNFGARLQLLSSSPYVQITLNDAAIWN